MTFGCVTSSLLYHAFADILHQKMTETCASAHIGGVNIVLLEGITPDIQYVNIPLNFLIPDSSFGNDDDCFSAVLLLLLQSTFSILLFSLIYNRCHGLS